jgi:hypothetical protein
MSDRNPIIRFAAITGFIIFGVIFFFAIIGVFGLTAAIGGLILFALAALVSVTQNPGEEAR